MTLLLLSFDGEWGGHVLEYQDDIITKLETTA